MSSAETTSGAQTLGSHDRSRLLEIARASIDHGLESGRALDLDSSFESPALRRVAGCFITLRIDDDLRGCMGTLEPIRALACDVASNAFRTAFRDPRFPPLTAEERLRVSLQISVLGPRSPLVAPSEQALIAALRPGVDGLVLDDGLHRATFLPAVWESLPDGRDFVRELKRKAGLAADGWSTGFRFERYETESIGENAGH